MHSRFKTLNKYNLEKIQSSTAVIVGLGATGSVIAEHLARHGVDLILIDRDYLEENDLYSSNLYSSEQIEEALPKAKAAEEKLSELTDVESHVEDLNSDNIELLNSGDIVMDGTDNIETRYLIEEYSKENGVPWVYTAALGERAFSMFIEEACFKCMFDQVNPKESCETNGILREISNIAASISCIKALEYLSGKTVEEKLEIIPEMDEFLPAECSCSESREIEASNVCGEDKYQVFGDSSPEEFKGEVIASNDYLKRLVFEGSSLTVFESGRAIIEAESLEEAERLYRTASSI